MTPPYTTVVARPSGHRPGGTGVAAPAVRLGPAAAQVPVARTPTAASRLLPAAAGLAADARRCPEVPAGTAGGAPPAETGKVAAAADSAGRASSGRTVAVHDPGSGERRSRALRGDRVPARGWFRPRRKWRLGHSRPVGLLRLGGSSPGRPGREQRHGLACGRYAFRRVIWRWRATFEKHCERQRSKHGGEARRSGDVVMPQSCRRRRAPVTRKRGHQQAQGRSRMAHTSPSHSRVKQLARAKPRRKHGRTTESAGHVRDWQ